ncbi:MAG: baseplate J/gp47 family protein [Candidatus Schekmanbacteria bacterium]|nr:baseplate J/gp47 family protein [Candidatus Schekmanbacteria bacterium]
MKTPQIQYSSKDYQTLLADLKQKIPYYLPEWTDHNDSDFGIVLLQLFSHVADILHFYLDRMLNEAFLPTVYGRDNLINLLKLIDYKLAGAVPATVDLTFTLGQTYTSNISIPKGAKCQSVGNEVIYFETEAGLVIPAGQLSGIVGATEGQSGEETLGSSDGTAYQKFAINASPIIDGTLKVFVAGEEWTGVDSLALSEPEAKEYYTQRDADEKITVFFGDDSQGKIPPDGTEITCQYRAGGGVRGNLGPNTITIINSSILHQGMPIAVSVTNNEAASGGADRESAEHAKAQAPLQLRALNRCVTEDDYETLAQGYPGVARAKCAPIEPKSYRAIDLYIVPNGGGLPSESLKSGLQAYLEGKRMVLDLLTVQDAVYVSIDIEGTVYVKTTYVQTVVEKAVREALDNFFAYTSEYVDFGRGIYLSDLYRLLDEIAGVDHVNLGSQMTNVTLQDNEFPKLGTVSLSFSGGA